MNRFPGAIRYVAATMTYGAVRKIVRLKDAEVELCGRDLTKKRVPMLLSQKALLTVIGTFSAIYIWPYYAYTDLQRLEIDYHKRDASVYGFRPCTSMIDYVLD